MIPRKKRIVRMENYGHANGARPRPNFELAISRMKAMKREVASQSAKFYPVISKTFEKTLEFVPREAVEKVLQERGQTYDEFKMDMFSRVLFVPQEWFNELRDLTGCSKGTAAFYFNGHCVLPSNGRQTKSVVFFSLMHEMIHSFDAAAGIRRNQASVEALAYAAQIFSFGEIVNVAEARAYDIGKGPSEEYTHGFHLGKEAAEAALEIKKIRGPERANIFFKNLFRIGGITSQGIAMLKRELLG